MKLIKSLKKIDYKLFFALIVLGLVPTIYTTVRVFFLGSFPSEYSFSIAGQLSWVNLFYEIIQESIILPLYFFMGKVISDKKQLTNRVKTGLIVSFAIYLVLSLIIFIFAEPLLSLMSTSPDIIGQSATYIRIESVASLIGILSSFLLVVLVQIGKQKYLYYLTALKLVMCVVLDTFLVSNLSVSAKLGVNGIGFSNIIVNIVLFVISLILVNKENIKIFEKSKLDFSWMKDFAKIGGISGLESFVRNIAYMLMICRMVNVVGEQGTYWVANNFIWGWLLLPILQLAELIKKDCAEDEKAIQNKSLGYVGITAIVCLLWCVTIPLWKPFMTNVLQFNDVDKLFDLVLVLLGFYVVFAFQNVFDAIFYGIGKTSYMLFESIVTNTVYYGVCFILYITGVWTPSLIGIALMFGIGNAFDGIVSLGVYIYLLKKRKINILNVEG
ncbi:MAG: MATE family efflux transporter [Clostridia bacterium]|nr:MATE family efflux transporter [Clostridia bacterium]